MLRTLLKKTGLITILSFAPSNTAAQEILPFSQVKNISYPQRAESVRELAMYILKANLPSTKQNCWTDKGQGKTDFSDPEIQYQLCKVNLQFPEGLYIVTVVNQNESRKDPEEKDNPSLTDYLAISLLKKKSPIHSLGRDEYLDGWAEDADQEEFYSTVEKLNMYFRIPY